MIESDKFIRELHKNNISHLVVVPCSFAKGLINSCINNSELIEYIPCASEAVACSIASGLALSGKKPVVIIQSSGLTNMGSCLTSLSNPYEIFFPIICSWRTYKEGDSEIQHKHLSVNLTQLINSYGYEFYKINSNMDDAINIVNKSFKRKIILLIGKETFTTCLLNKKFVLNLTEYPKRSLYLKSLNKLIKFKKNFVCIGTTGNTSREMHCIMKNSSNFYMAGNMGGALSLGLGAVLGGKDAIICGGDAEFVMHLGGLTTAGRYSDKYLIIYILFDNEVNKSTGAQNSYQQHINYLSLAKSCGWTIPNNTIKSISDFQISFLKAINSEKGFHFLHVKCDLDQEFPRPSVKDIIESKNSFN